MQTVNMYIKDWLAIHPYTRQQPTDVFFLSLSKQLYHNCLLTDIPESTQKKICLYTAAYLEDIISGLGLWQTFTHVHNELYNTLLPFYSISSAYQKSEINKEDIRFIIWNTLQKAIYKHPYVNPLCRQIETTAQAFFQILDDVYETAPENYTFKDFFTDFDNEKNANQKLHWLFGHSYLTEPSVQEYITQVTETDKFIIPCGPLALFLHEWISQLAGEQAEMWKSIKGLYPVTPPLSEETKARNRHIFDLFTQGTNGAYIIYLNSYKELHHFLTRVLQWPDDANHTLPQMKAHRNFVMMAHPDKGILLAKDICEYISDPLNPIYNQEIATREAFRLLSVPTLCPPDLMEYLIQQQYIPDAQFPDFGEKELLQKNADFVARHSLLYYYRGD